MPDIITTPEGFKTEDLTGCKFSRLTAVKFLGFKIRHAKDRIVRIPMWECLCDCGKKMVCQRGNLKSGHTQSCGCLKKEGNNYKHGFACGKKTKAYKHWLAVKKRCYNSNSKEYKHWGGRGIGMCDEWRESFVKFHTDKGEKPPGLSLHRVDNDAGYSPANCIWADQKTQNRAYRQNVKLTFNGKTQCVIDWATELGMPWSSLYRRVKAGWPVARILTEPVSQTKRHITFNGKTQSIREWAKDLGTTIPTLASRIHMGWSVEKMLTTPVNKHNKKAL